MLAFPSMLVAAAEKAGMKVPPKDKVDNYQAYKEKYPHFYIFCLLQLGRRMMGAEHWKNARIIASLSTSKIKKMTLTDIIREGFIISLN